MNTYSDILERLRIDPGQRTVGELLQDREHACHEIIRLRSEVECLRAVGTRREARTKDLSSKTQQPHALVRLTEVCELVGVCRATIYRWISDGAFPGPVHVSKRAVRWRIDDIERWRDSP